MQDWPSKPPHIDPTTSTRPPAPAAHCHRRGQTQRCRRRAAWGPWRGSNRQRLHRWGKANQIVSARLLASSKKCAAFTPLRLAGAFVTHSPGRLKCFFATAVMILPYDARSEALTRRSASGGGQRGKRKGRLRSRPMSEMQQAPPPHPAVAPLPPLVAARPPHSQVRSLSCSHRRMSLVGSAL